MKIRRSFFVYLLAASTWWSVTSCKKKPDDAALTQTIQTKLKDIEGVTVSVKDGAVVLGGEVTSDVLKDQAEAAVKGVDGVVSVMNSITIHPSPSEDAPVEPVTINSDNSIQTAVQDNLKKYNISGVTATVNDGIVTLTGTVSRSQLQDVMKAANETKPKQVKNELTIQ